MHKNLKILGILALCFALMSCASVRSRYYTVKRGDTFSGVANKFGVSVSALRVRNSSVRPNRMMPGTRLYIPFETRSDWNRSHKFRRPSAIARRGDSRDVGAAAGAFRWPVSGRLSSRFGPRGRSHHDGIDIAARRGTPVRAARSGHVIYAGNKIRGYGNLVVVRHPGSYTSVYAHLSRIEVRKGQYVRRGGAVGRVGRTGRATGDHLHFEIRKDRAPVNPLFYLQRQIATNRVGR